VALMRDEYPPFRLDQGGSEPTTAGVEPPSEGAPASGAAALAPPVDSGWTAGRIVLIVVGTIVGLFAFALLAGGCALVVVDQTQRDDDGFLMSPTSDFSTPTFAIVSEKAELNTHGSEWALDKFLGTVRIRSESDRPVFVGIGPAAAVTRYLGGVQHDVVDDLDSSGDPEYSRRPGDAPAAPPGEQTFWVASATGAGERTLEWDPKSGDWRAVVMNQDASRGVSSEMSIGAELDSVLWIGIGLLVGGVLFAAGSALLITAAVRHRH